ncbi:MAG: molybdate ABC transporter substrate-binding protein [Fervidicoccaceae archaeon]
MSSRRVAVALFFVIVVISVVYIGALSKKSERLVVYAGAAAAPVYREAVEVFQRETGVRVELRLGGSGALLSQLLVARDGDLYVPGSQEFLWRAAQLGVLDSSRRPVVLAYLVPALIVAKGNPKNITSIEDLARPGVSIAIADPEAVCVGLYAKEILERIGLWSEASKNIKVYASSCEHLASLVTTGAVDAVLGWHVFHFWDPNATELVLLRPGEAARIGYIAGAVTAYSKNKELAEEFLKFLSSEKMAEVWRRYGYLPTLEEALKLAPGATAEELP